MEVLNNAVEVRVVNHYSDTSGPKKDLSYHQSSGSSCENWSVVIVVGALNLETQ